MSDLVSNEYVVTAPASGGSKLAVETYTDSGDSIAKVLPWSAILWGTKGGDYFLPNASTPLPVEIIAGAVVTQYAEDAAHVSGNSGMMTLAVRNDVIGSLSGTDGDYSPFQVNSRGSLRVMDEAANGAFSNAGITNAAVSIMTAAGKITYLSIENVNTSKCYLQIFDVASAGSVTVGSTIPKWSFPIAPGGVQEFLVALRFVNGCAIAATTTYGGATAPTSASLVNAAYIS